MSAILSTFPYRVQPTPPSTIGFRLLSLAKAVAHIALYYLAKLVSFLICHSSHSLTVFITQQQQKKEAAWRAFRGILPQPLTAEQRENRIRDAADIPHRLNKEWHAAQAEMSLEPDKPFQYREAPAHFAFAHIPVQRQANGVLIGTASHIGSRDHFEDRSLTRSFEIRTANGVHPVQAFGVFDGHNGSQAAEFVRDHFVDTFTATLGRFSFDEAGIWNALKLTFVELNRQFKQCHPNDHSGTTACVVLILNGQLWCANVGDSRAILTSGDQAFQLSDDAKPTDPKYQKGIQNRGGYVLGGRIAGNLAVARAIGDRDIRGVSARPKITNIPLAEIPANAHLILGSDGFWDVTSSRQAAQAARLNPQPLSLAKNLVYSAQQAGSRDNTTVMVAHLHARKIS